MKEIKGKGDVMELAYRIWVELEEQLKVYETTGYGVKFEAGDISASLSVYSTFENKVITSSVIEDVQDIAKYYGIIYGMQVFYNVDYLEEERCGCVRISIMGTE